MTEWAAFVGLTCAVLSGFLLLARLSQGAVGDAAAQSRDGSADERPVITDHSGVPAEDGSIASTDDGSVAPPDDGAAASTEGSDATPASADGRRADGYGHEPRVDAPQHGERPAHRQLREMGQEGPAMTPGLLLVNVVLTQGLFGTVLAAGAWYFRVPPSALGIGGGTVTGVSALAVGVGFGLVLWVGNELASGIADAAGADYDEGLRRLLAPEGVRGWALLLGVTLPLIALIEEFLFRAAAVGVPAAGFETSPWALAVVSSVAFALGHGAQGRAGIAVTGALGFALAGGFVLTGSLLVVVVAHYLVNALEFLAHEWAGLPDPVWS